MNYKLVRSKRKSLAICITGGEVIVKAPTGMSTEHIENFVAQKSGWIAKKLAEYDRKSDMLKPVIDGDGVLVYGVPHPIACSEKHKRVAIADGALQVPSKYVDAEKRRSAVKNHLKRLAATELSQALEYLSVRTGLKYKSFAITDARTKWGSCDGDCNIRLNWRLVMLDAELLEYVIVHELCHTKHHDHSAAFWAEVKKHCPKCADAKKRLKQYSVLTALYR